MFKPTARSCRITRHVFALAGVVALLAGAGSLGGCQVKEDYRLAKTSISVDPRTGHLIRTNVWEMGDGTTEVTYNDITAQGNDLDRRDPPTHTTLLGPPGFF